MTGQTEAKSALTDFLNQVGEEEVTICIDGQPKKVTKAEALARKMYLLALGGFEEVQMPDGTIEKFFHKPDYKVAKLIREFTEGKAAAEFQPNKDKGKKPGAFTSDVGRRLNQRLGLKRPVNEIKGETNE